MSVYFSRRDFPFSLYVYLSIVASFDITLDKLYIDEPEKGIDFFTIHPAVSADTWYIGLM